MTAGVISSTVIVDADSHITEPADIWTARIPAKYHEQIPQVTKHPDTGVHHWRIGQRWLVPVGFGSVAGWKEFPPSGPKEYEDCDPASFDSRERLRRMDEFGVAVQILYPNLVGAGAAEFMKLELELSERCVRAYNDFALEWASADPERLVPMAMLPFWDLDASIRELNRCVGLGFRGVLFSNRLEQIGLPRYVDPYWDPLYAAAQDCDVPVNFHVGFYSKEASQGVEAKSLALMEAHPGAVRIGAVEGLGRALMDQATLIGSILLSGLCERFPRLKLVSVEAGFGHLPFYLEALDWQWRSYGNTSLPMLPSEYFARQCYSTFWFDRTALRLLDVYPDNFMFSTDFPHPTSLSPGPCGGTSLMPSAWVEDAFVGIPSSVKAKAVYGNAERIYKLNIDHKR